MAEDLRLDVDTSSIEDFCLSASEIFGCEINAASMEELMDSCEDGHAFAEAFIMKMTFGGL